jgi:site-specific DNA recombinase
VRDITAFPPFRRELNLSLSHRAWYAAAGDTAMYASRHQKPRSEIAVSKAETARTKSDALLLGRIYDDQGHRMTPSHVRKQRIKYRYYLSSALLHGRSRQAGTVRRVPAGEIEALVTNEVRKHLKAPAEIEDRLLIQNHVERVEVRSDHVFIELAHAKTIKTKRKEKQRSVIQVPWQKTPSTRRREVLAPENGIRREVRPIRSESRALLVASIARGRRWLDELIADPKVNTEGIAAREGCSVRQVNLTISLAFLAPDLVRAAIKGRLPHGCGVAQMRDLPSEWACQRQMLGL